MNAENDELEDSQINREAAGDSGPDDTAPDSETQSGMASEAGGRTSEKGSRAPNAPAEGSE